MATTTLNVTFSMAVLIDINTAWTNRVLPVTNLFAATAVAAADTTITLSSAAEQIKVNGCLLIEEEPMTVTEINGNILTVQRGNSQGGNGLPLAAAVDHAAGAPVSLLLYPSPYRMLVDLGVRPVTQQLVNELGPRSATFAATVTGTTTA